MEPLSPLRPEPRTLARVDLRRLRANFLHLARLGREHGVNGLVAMVKADAYGHGLLPVARAIAREQSLAAFGLATLQEGEALREAGLSTPALVFADGLPFDEGLIQRYRRSGLTAVVHDLQDLRRIVGSRDGLAFHLKINTGLNRLGMDRDDLVKAMPLLKKALAQGRFAGVFTHFAAPEDPRGALSRQQIARFREALAVLGAAVPPQVPSSSTRALFETRPLGLSGLCTWARPGIGLYGYGLPERAGLKPVLQWSARVLRVRRLKKGDRVGYGGTFRAPRAMDEAVLGLGYGDGLPRILSNRSLGSRAILGRVSMDMTCVEGKGLRTGSRITVLGDGIAQGEGLAQAADTIIYELLTAISKRVPRVYHGV